MAGKYEQMPRSDVSKMLIELCVDSRQFVNPNFPEATADIDLDTSLRIFAQLLETEMKRMYPTAELSITVSGSCETFLRFNHEDIATTDQPEARIVYADAQYAMDKLFFFGAFWVDKKREPMK
jgi:hypothetical protein